MKTPSLPRALVAISCVVPASLALLTGCPSGGGGSVGGAPIPYDQFGKVAAEKLCAAVQSCCNQNGFTDEAKACNQTSAAALQASMDEQKAKHPDYVYDAQKAGNCVAAVAAVYSTCNTKGADTGDTPDCDGFFRGTKPLGSSCSSSSECAASGPGTVRCAGLSSSSSADGGTSTTSGVCIATKKAAEGDPCLSYAADTKPDPAKVYGDCDYGSDDLYCDTVDKSCKKRGAAGATCVVTVGTNTTSNAIACAKGFTCDYASKACVALPGVGEACQGGYNCAEGAYCDATTKKCAAQKAGGEPCGTTSTGGANECQHGCDSTSKKCRANDVTRKLCSGASG